jgi:hypothetical protein
LPFISPLEAHHIFHPEGPRNSTCLRLHSIGGWRSIRELGGSAVRRCPNTPHIFSLLIAGEEKLVVPPGPTAFAQRTVGRALEELVLPIVLPDCDETFWVQHEEAVVYHLVLSGELVQFEGIIIVITVVPICFELSVRRGGEAITPTSNMSYTTNG